MTDFPIVDIAGPLPYSVWERRRDALDLAIQHLGDSYSAVDVVSIARVFDLFLANG